MPVVTETQSELNNSEYIEGTELRFRIYDGDIGPDGTDLSGATTVGERIFVQARVPIARDDGRKVPIRVSEWRQLDDAVILGFTAGDSADLRALLKKAYDWLKANVPLSG